MATVFRLADHDAANTVNIMSGTLKLVDYSWRTSTPRMAGGYRHLPYGSQFEFSHFAPVTETFQLVGDDTVSNLIAASNALEDAIEGARKYHNDTMVIDSWWLEANANGENARRSLLYGGDVTYEARPGFDPLLDHSHMLATINLQRHPFWERSSYTTITNNATSCWGGMWSITSIPGVAPARLRYTTLTFDSGGTLVRVWMGIRDGYTSVTGFDPTWDLADACTYENDTVDSGTYATTTISTSPGMLRRISKTLNQHDSVSPGIYIGRYVVLLRCKVDAGVVVAVRMKSGYKDSDYCVPNEIVYVDNSSDYMVKNLGEVSIPAVGRSIGHATSALQYFEIELWAELVTDTGGTDHIYWEDLCIIPADHFVYMENLAIAGAASPAYVITDPDDTKYGYAKKATGADFHVNPEIRDWYLPTGSSMLILAAERAAAINTGDTLDIQLDYIPRYYSYRDS